MARATKINVCAASQNPVTSYKCNCEHPAVLVCIKEALESIVYILSGTTTSLTFSKPVEEVSALRQGPWSLVQNSMMKMQTRCQLLVSVQKLPAGHFGKASPFKVCSARGRGTGPGAGEGGVEVCYRLERLQKFVDMK